MLAPIFIPDIVERDAAHGNPAGVKRIEAEHQLDQCRFSASAHAHDRRRFPGGNTQRQLVDQRLRPWAVIAERHVVEYNVATCGNFCHPVACDVLLVRFQMDFIEPFQTQLGVLSRLDEKDDLLDRALHLPDYKLDREHHPQRDPSGDNRGSRDDRDAHVFDFIDKRSARLLPLVQV